MAFSVVQWTVVVAFTIIFILRFVYLFLFTARVTFSSSKARDNVVEEPISIILTVRNEEENVRKNLQTILQFENVDFEVVAIDDYSFDNTLSVLGLLKQRFKHLKVSNLSQETRFSVKMAQNIAFKSATNNWVLFMPIALAEVNETWLKSFAQKTGMPKANLIVGYATVSAQKGFFNLLYRVEAFFQQMQSAAYIFNGIPFVNAEENVAFKKEKYYEIGGYYNNLNEPYANLELIVNSFIKKNHTLVNFNANSVIRKNKLVDRAEFLDLLKKNVRIEKNLSYGKRFFLLFDSVTKLLFIPLLAISIVLCFEIWLLIITLVGVYAFAQLLIIKISLNRLNERKIFIPSLLYALLMPFYKLFFRWYFSKKSRKQQWRNML